MKGEKEKNYYVSFFSHAVSIAIFSPAGNWLSFLTFPEPSPTSSLTLLLWQVFIGVVCVPPLWLEVVLASMVGTGGHVGLPNSHLWY